MDLIKCPRCGEMYSPSYRSCPFCEEEDRPRKASVRRGGHRISDKKQMRSARGSVIAVLLVVLVLLSWYLFGGKFMEKIQQRQNTPVEDTDNDPANDPTIDPGYDPSIGDEPAIEDPDAPTPPSLDDPEDPQDTTPTTPSTPTVDASSLTLKTNVGSLNKDAGTGKYDCTIKTSESVRLILQGTDAQVTWSSGDESVVTVASDGTLKPLKAGMTTVTAKVGNAAVECIIRVKG